MRGRSRYSLNNRIDSMWPRWWFVSPRNLCLSLSLSTMISFPSSRFERIVIVIVRYSNFLNFENWIFEYAGILNTLFKLNSRRKIIMWLDIGLEWILIRKWEINFEYSKYVNYLSLQFWIKYSNIYFEFFFEESLNFKEEESFLIFFFLLCFLNKSNKKRKRRKKKK